ncbi:MAG: Gmad2 immunoglobulin-like domain-containing protein [Actinomycetota bacterium]|nr:Gmad2 immunoglobulin-like domain-containing protein [Actinomycetota bacterium]
MTVRRRSTAGRGTVLAALALVGLMACGSEQRARETPSSTGPASTPSTKSAPTATSTTAASTVAAFAGIWPFTSQAEVDAYAAGPERAYRDPSTTARQFAARYVGMEDPAAFGFRASGSGGDVGVGPGVGEGGRRLENPKPTTVVLLEQLGPKGPSGPWSVVAARSPAIELKSPAAGSAVSSPVTLTGRANAFEGTVAVQVKEDGMLASQSLGKGFVTASGGPAGELGPFRDEVSFRTPTKPGGAIVLYEGSAADGQGVLRATVVRVLFAT